MDLLLQESSAEFIEYAARDAVVSLLYSNTLFGYNMEMPCTVTGVAANAARTSCMKYYLGCTSQADFDRIYRGIRMENIGLVKQESSVMEKPNFLKNTR